MSSAASDRKILSRFRDGSQKHRAATTAGLLDRETVSVDIPDLEEMLRKVGHTVPLDEALGCKEEEPLSTQERQKLVDLLIRGLEHTYVHLPLKRTKHAFDPVAALRRLRREAEDYGPLAFHLRIMRIFKSLRDQHTSYNLPEPYSNMIAFLPFLMGICYDPPDPDEVGEDGTQLADPLPDVDPHPKFILTSLFDGFPDHAHFKPGAEILSWNGTPIDLVARRIGQSEQASNPASELAIGMRLMTVRWLGGSLPPEEYVVTVSYRSPDDPDRVREIRFGWNVIYQPGDRNASIQGLWNMLDHFKRDDRSSSSQDNRSRIEKTARQSLFPSRYRDGVSFGNVLMERLEIDPKKDPFGCFRAWKVKLDKRRPDYDFGLVRLVHFGWNDDVYYRDCFVKLLKQMPETGLAIDIRSNPGGEIKTAEMILQTLTDRPIQPMQFQFLANDVVEDLVQPQGGYRKLDVKGWYERVRPSAAIGSMFSRFGPVSRADRINKEGQVYKGPVLLITNAVTYSSGDIFAASFQDHGIGPILGVDASTGGGGANVWPYKSIMKHSQSSAPERRFDPLPGGANVNIAVRRCTRLGDLSGMPIEESGVVPDIRYYPTRRDLLEQDFDLLARIDTELRKVAEQRASNADRPPA